MYQFYYDYLKPKYGDKCTHLFTDTDSFFCHFQTEDGNFYWYSTFLLSHHRAFLRTRQILLTQHILLTQRIFAETAHFTDLSKFFCWYNIFFPSFAIFKPKMTIFTEFLLSDHHVFVLTNQILLTQHILLNQLIFAATANFLLTQLSFAESSSDILITQQVFLLTQRIFGDPSIFADTAHDTA